VQELTGLLLKVEKKRFGGGDGKVRQLLLDPPPDLLNIPWLVTPGVKPLIADNNRANQGRILSRGLNDIVDLGC